MKVGGESADRALVLSSPNPGPIAELELIAENKEAEAVFMTDPQILSPDKKQDLDELNKDLANKILKTESQADEANASPLNDLERAMAS
jgi:hypothetical protein